MEAMKRASPILLALILAACGTDVTGPSSSLFACVFGDAVAMSPGEARQVEGAGNQGVCLSGSASTEFVYIPFYAATDSVDPLSLDVTGAGVADQVGALPDMIGLEPPVAALGAAVERRRPLSWDYAFHDRLRRREAEELEPLIRAGPVAAAVADPRVAADVPAVGDLRDFNVAISCVDRDMRTGRVMYVSQHAVVVADTANPADLDPGDYAFFAETFDTLVYPVETAAFGTPTDIDDNGRVILFFTRAVNELNAHGSESVTIGFFWSGDLFPATGTPRLEACPESNHGEMFYLLAPDPDGEAGVEFTLDDIRRFAIPLIGHEFQHLINASRRLFVNNAFRFEAGWLNEGLSHIAEELLFFAVSAMPTGANLAIEDFDTQDKLDAFNRYMGGNFTNLARFLDRPDTASVMGKANHLATRGAAWSFLRYAADRSEDPGFFFDVVNSETGGIANLDQVLGGGEALNWMRDWTVSLYADDRVPGVDPRFTAGTWNLRSVYEGSTLGTYPIRVRSLTSGQPLSVDLLGGGTTFNRFGVGDAGRAAIHAETDGGPPPSALRGTFLRVR
jgi:hypothetical protein